MVFNCGTANAVVIFQNVEKRWFWQLENCFFFFFFFFPCSKAIEKNLKRIKAGRQMEKCHTCKRIYER